MFALKEIRILIHAHHMHALIHACHIKGKSSVRDICANVADFFPYEIKTRISIVYIELAKHCFVN